MIEDWQGWGHLGYIDDLKFIYPWPGVYVIRLIDAPAVHRQTTTTAHFLDTIKRRMPFPVRATQVDGGSELEALFEEECRKRGIKLFILPPRSPRLNGGVERAHRTHTEEFYEVTDSPCDTASLRNELLAGEKVCDTARPHQPSVTLPRRNS